MKLTIEEIDFLLDRARRSASYQNGGSISVSAVQKLERRKHVMIKLILCDPKDIKGEN